MEFSVNEVRSVPLVLGMQTVTFIDAATGEWAMGPG